MTAINPSESKWQVSDEFKADKASLWKYPPEKDGWMLAHNMLREEITNLNSSLQGVADKFPNSTPDWAVDSIKALWAHHYDVVMDHHRNEDEIMNPFMKTRVQFPEKLEADHQVLVTLMNEIKNAVDELKTGDSLVRLLDLMESYQTTMFPHLAEEERVALPLLRNYFTPKEVKEKVAEIMQTTGPGELGSFIDAMGVDYFRSTFMTQEGIPFFVWYLKFRKDYNHYQTNVKCHFKALKEGVPVTPQKATFLC